MNLERPFHLSIIPIIENCLYGDRLFLAELIKATIIPEGHDDIIKTWTARMSDICCENYGVTESVMEQKLCLKGGRLLNELRKKPFHVSIIPVIKGCLNENRLVLSKLIKTTIIPEDYDILIEAWSTIIRFLRGEDCGVTESVARQKFKKRQFSLK